jgi:signal transduction histidine kinase
VHVSSRTPEIQGRASLERALVRKRTMHRYMHPLAALAVVLVGVGSVLAQPRPGLAGEHLGILLALAGLAVGVAGVVKGHSLPLFAQICFYGLLMLGSGALVWLQPNGSGFLGVFVAVSAAALALRGLPGASIALAALLVLPVAGIFGKDESFSSIGSKEVGVIAFYVVALLANRLREGQEQAEQLLEELEQTREAQARAAVLGERQRLAREMHDVLAHSLSGLALQLESARLLTVRRGADSEVVDALERAHHLAKNGIEEARRAIGMLRDDELPGPERLPSLVADFERDAGIPATIAVSGRERPLDPEARLTLYRTAQEALTNVRRHAHAEWVELRLEWQPEGARLTVEDFAANGSLVLPNGGGFGLTGMRERAELLGGTLAAAPTANGFRVELWVPA